MNGALLSGLIMLTVLGLGFLAGVVAKPCTPPYQNPQLHEGRWKLVGQDGRDVVWRKQGGQQQHQAYHECQAHECRVTEGMAHVDQCVCGKKRYGVFGSWD